MSSENIHLLVLVHGMWGDPCHLAEMHRIIREVRGQQLSEAGPNGERLHAILAETNRADSTYDGIDWGGERVTEEIYEEVKRLEGEGKKVTRFSITGYSLGGLISRYVVGILHQRKFFENVTPVNFNTFATPHIGLPRYRTILSSVFSALGPTLLSRTGEQFYAVDKWSARGRPLLEVMADPNRIFFQALSLFQHIRIYANAVDDTTVPYVTAAIEAEDPFINHRTNGIKIEFDEQYKPLLNSYKLPDVPLPPPARPLPLSPKWFSDITSRPFLPPRLQFSFPWNILIYLAIPLILPLGITLVLTRLALASRASRARVRLLEEDETYTQRLAHIIGQLERDIEDKIADIIEEPSAALQPASVATSRPESPAPLVVDPTSPSASTLVPFPEKVEKAPHPVLLTDLQRNIITWLNTLPGLKKELAFIHPVRNAHGPLICRDVRGFAAHKVGEGVLRHWADHFIM
ncbi:DUF676-domain-containing protein [Obba rivulosa]|uniref:DUF676-domain-containing protein n=1 Tax=Obba rivulosa TaxID=1052685 RepID=A0A8E2J764_9APHY|nr:DUF676-domain-containing protein [Obba rivulosa]